MLKIGSYISEENLYSTIEINFFRRKLERTLQLSEGVGMNGTKSLPRRPTYRLHIIIYQSS